MKNEYWCSVGNHWVDELRVRMYGTSFPICQSCTTGEWEEYKPSVRQVKEPKYVVTLKDSGDWHVMVSATQLSRDYSLTKSQAEEIAALRNKWEDE